MVSCKDKIIIFPLFNTCYPQNLARNLASFFGYDILPKVPGIVCIDVVKMKAGINDHRLITNWYQEI